MAGILLSPIYLLVNYYVLRRVLKWMGACTHLLQKRWFQALFIIIYLFFCLSPLISFLLPRGDLQSFFKQINNDWLGCFLYILLFLGAGDLIRFILKKIPSVPRWIFESRKIFVAMGSIVTAAVILFSTYGILHCQQIMVTDYEITIEKKGPAEQMTIVLVADLHLGYSVGVQQLKQMVEKVNHEKPDLVCIAGDIFDNSFEALAESERICELLGNIESRYGIYACYGNHDVKENIFSGFTLDYQSPKFSDPRMDELLERANVTLLNDQVKLVDDSFYIIGRYDARKPANGMKTRKSPQELIAGLDLKKPVIVLDHQPKQLEELANCGVDLDLSGHTHDGQLFPGNLIVKFVWENPCGYLQKGKMHSIVTSGVGVWGPSMRVGTNSEITVIHTNFQNET